MAFGGDVEVVSSSSPTLSCSEGGWRRSLAIQGLSKCHFGFGSERVYHHTAVEHHTRKESSGCLSLEKSFRPAGGRPSSSWHWCRQGGSPPCSSPPWTAFSRRKRTSTMFVINPSIEMTWQDNVCDQSLNRKDMINSTTFAITVATVRNALIVSSHLGVKQFRLLAIFRWKRSVFEVAVKIACLFIHSS